MTKSHSVLLIEDDEGDQLLIKRIFSKLDLAIDLQIAVNGEVALENLKELVAQNKTLPNLILVDLNMPVMNGKSFLKRIKINEKLKYIPLVILTTSDYVRDIEDSYNLCANGFVIKPLDYDQLNHKIEVLTRYWLTVNVNSSR